VPPRHEVTFLGLVQFRGLESRSQAVKEIARILRPKAFECYRLGYKPRRVLGVLDS